MRRSTGVLSGQFIVLGTALVVVALVISSLISLRTEMLDVEEERERVISQIEVKWLPLLSRAVWILSDDDIELITLAIAQPEEIDALSLEIHGGETIKLGDSPEHHRADIVWPIRYERGDETLEVGSLTVSVHVPTFRELAAQLLPHILPADLIKILAVLVPFFLLVHFAVTRQLSRLTAAVSSMSHHLEDHDLAELSFARTKIFSADDELDELLCAFNALLAGIREERRIRGDREIELKRSLEHSEFLVREVHHRVKNNLQMLISLFSLHAARLGESERAVILEAERRIRSLALVHIQLYQEQSITSVELVTYAQSLLYNLAGSSWNNDGAEVLISVSGDRVDLPLDKAIPLALVLNELATNALKHAFPSRQGGALSVVVKRTGESVVVSVCDDGQGLGSEFSLADNAGFGLTIVATLLDQIDAEIRYADGPSGGTCFFITVPVR